MAYATVSDVEARTTHTYTADEQTVIGSLLDDVAVLIDSYNKNADPEAKKVVSCRAVIRAMGDGDITPLGATQGSLSAGGYSQSWTYGSGGGSGELYINKTEQRLLGCGDAIGTYSPVEEMATPSLFPLCLGVGHYD